MITIAKRVEELIENWPMLKQGLDLDLLNTSAVARYLKPEVEKAVGERISEAAVLMALRRYSEKNQPKSKRLLPKDYLGDMSMRSNLVDFTYTNSPTLQRSIAQIAHDLPPQHYFTLARGQMQTSIIFHKAHIKLVNTKLKNERAEKKVPGLTSLTMQLIKRHGQVPGIIAYPLQLLAWKGIPVVEFVSTYDELNIILHDEDVEAAFSTLNSALK